ncbi:MAG: hypothetical protein HN580_28010 [Deltaproteobacteria bacterium]|nr:hypothetical protein [Deltaproteobacteria bacterium]
MKKVLFLLVLFCLLGFSGCGDDGDSSGDDTPTETTIETDATTDTDTTTDGTPASETGYRITDANGQKGPCRINSNVTIQERDTNYNPVGDQYTEKTEDNFGTVVFGNTFSNPIVDISYDCFYFVENTGLISDSRIILRSISDLSVSTKIITNLVTSLGYDRAVNLIEGGLSITDGKLQAEKEVLEAFKIFIQMTESFDQADISVDDQKGGILLAISAIIQQDNSAGEVSDLVGNFANDLKADGTIDDPAIIAELKTNAQNVNLEQIRTNVESFFGGISLNEYQKYIDSDGDGILNFLDDDTPDAFSFTPVLNADLSTSYESNTVTISGLSAGGTIQVTGSAYKNGVPSSNFTLANGDLIKFILTSSTNYGTAVSSSVTIDGTSYVYSVTTKLDDRQQIIVYDSGQPAMDGDFGAANAQTWCSAQATVNSLTGTVIPWLSTNSDLKDAITQDAVNPRKVTSLSGDLVANQWNSFFNDEGTDSFQTLGIVDDGYWTGTVDGAKTYNCDGWTRNGNVVNELDYANYNRHDIAARTTDGAPQAVNTTQCDQLKKILCIAF